LISAKNKQLTMGISQTATASFRIRADNALYDLLAAGDTMLKVYDSGQRLCYYGPVVADEESAQGQGASVNCSSADLSWFLARRFDGKDADGVGLQYDDVDSGVIAYDLLSQVNAERPTGITAGIADTFITRTVGYQWKRMLDALSELGAIDGSYEWQLRYVDGTPPTVYLDLRGRFGSDQSAVVFLEYGTGKNNCQSYSRARSIETSATRVYALSAGSTLSSVAWDDQAETKWRLEDVITPGEITDVAMLDDLVALQVAVRRQARSTVNLTPFAKTAPVFGTDWIIGDQVGARVVINNSVRVNGPARVWGATFAFDDSGNARPTLQLEPT
jgi:hypothetical protein